MRQQGRSWAEMARFVGQRKLSITSDVYTRVMVDPAELEYERIRRVTDPSEEVQNEELRFSRAAAWARGQCLGPWLMGLSDGECRRIEELRDQIVALGEDTAHVDYECSRYRDPTES